MAEIPSPADPDYYKTSERLRRNGHEREHRDRPEPVIRVYVCPTEGCGNYYGSSSMGHLEAEANIGTTGSDSPGEVVSYRNECPACGAPRKLRYARLVPEDEVTAAERVARKAAV